MNASIPTRVRATVLAELRSANGLVVWQARISDDRGRLEIVGIVPPSTTPTEIAPLSDNELRELLSAAGPATPSKRWACRDCGAINEPTRRWCRACSSDAVIDEPASRRSA